LPLPLFQTKIFLSSHPFTTFWNRRLNCNEFIGFSAPPFSN
jgi:hypothetical protein